MGYRIEAFLKGGKPSLKIYDLEKGALCLSWTLKGSVPHQSQHELHRLFKKLLLLTCKQDLGCVRVFNLSQQHQAVQ